ncbi:MAG: hypothetical protein Q4A07_12935 [Coriobacteriales bacterium]|nr:hypothetical protein [Coriobacteriales bacterium]
MPQNKVQGRVYGLVMSLTMTFLMEVWATTVRAGVQLEPGGLSNIGWPVVAQAARGFLPTVAVVILIAETYGTKLAMSMAGRICDFRHDPQALCTLVRVGCNTLVMCSSVLLMMNKACPGLNDNRVRRTRHNSRAKNSRKRNKASRK